MSTVHDIGGLPAGMVTFLLTDVEGSTRMWEADPALAAVAIGRHRRLIDESVDAWHGARPLEQGEGDSTVSAFARATDAAQAARAAQEALADEPWPDGTAVRVRMALHTGEAEPAPDGTYAGAVLNRCARIRALAHGGQVLLSGAVADLIADHLTGDHPRELHITDLGAHRLKDLSRPERVWQLGGMGLDDEHPPLHSLDATPNNLPVQLSSFVGREQDISQGISLLGQTRVLTLTGAGGCGKTRLAQRVAGEVVEHYAAGAWWVELASLNDPDLLAETITSALSLHVPPERRALDVLTDRLAEDRTLVVLDNCEHLIDAAALLVNHLQLACSGVVVLATSREPLGIEGEVTWRVPSMGLPPIRPGDPGTASSAESGADSAAQGVEQYDAVRLFVDRAVQARPNFQVNNANAPAVAQICHRLDGIPLAIELAAARTRSLPPERIAAELDDRFRLLSGGSRAAMPRQQTLFASVDWSHELLDPAERAVLRRLSVFTGSFGLDAAEAVAAAEPIDGYEVLGILARLVDKSLVQADDTQGGTARYRLLETIRHYSLDRLHESGETASTRNRHLDWAVSFAEQHEAGATNAHPDVLDLLDADHANLRAALEWSISDDQADDSVRLVAMLGLFWAQRGHYAEAAALGPRAIAAAEGRADPVLVARARWAAAYVRFYGGDLFGAYEDATVALDAAIAAGDAQATARSTHILGTTLICVDPAETRRLLTGAAEIAESIGDEWCQADAMQIVGLAGIIQGDYVSGMAEMQEAYAISARLGNQFQTAWHHMALSMTAAYRGDLPTAWREGTEAIETARLLGDPGTEIWIVTGFAALLSDAGDAEQLAELVDRYSRRRTEWGLLGATLLPSVQILLGIAEDPLGAGDALLLIGDGLAEAMDVTDAVPRWIAAALASLAVGNVDEAIARAERCARFDAFPTYQAIGALVHAMALRRSTPGAAEEVAHRSMATLVRLGHRITLPWALAVLGGVAVDAGSAAEGARLLAASEAIGTAMGRRRNWVELADFDADVAVAAGALGEDFETVWAEGLALDADAAVAYVSRARGERKRPPFGWDSLTPTELACVELVAEGLTNPEIGERLFIGRGTVKTHLSHVFAKLGVRTRAELATAAAQRG